MNGLFQLVAHSKNKLCCRFVVVFVVVVVVVVVVLVAVVVDVTAIVVVKVLILLTFSSGISNEWVDSICCTF